MPHDVTKTVQAKQAIWEHAVACGWSIGAYNALYTTKGPRDTRVRLNFRDKDVLKFEHSRALNDEELKVTPHKATIWEVLEVAPYSKVELVTGGISFPKPKSKTVPAKKASRRKKKEEG